MSKLNVRKILLGLVLFGIAFVVVGSIGVISWEYSNSNDFCANACHQVHPQEPLAHELSQHANVDCVECHIGRMNFFRSALEKSGHMAHAWSLLVGYERPTHSRSLKSENSCESCHPKTLHHDNTIRVISHFADDRNNTEYKTTLIMRLVGRNFSDQKGLDLNWHASGAVRYAADDPQGLQVSWVEATHPDGSTRIYENVRVKSEDPETAPAPASIKTMDCTTCHNRVGHPFPNPEKAIENALDSGTISRDLPYIKKHLDALLAEEFTSEDEARALVRQSVDAYLQEFPNLKVAGVASGDLRSYLLTGEDQLVDLKVRSRFLEDDNVTWESFPDHTGHKEGPGCFRCHNGRLQTTEGVPIPVNCTTCHSIPMVTTHNQVPAYVTDIIGVEKPDDHADPAFMSVHMDLADDYCGDCHGEIDYGWDDKSHCSNSGCHASDWKYLDLDALR